MKKSIKLKNTADRNARFKDCSLGSRNCVAFVNLLTSKIVSRNLTEVLGLICIQGKLALEATIKILGKSMKYKILMVYFALSGFLGIYGFLFSPFHPELPVENFSIYFSIAFFFFISFIVIWLVISNKIKLIIKFKRSFNFYFFTFAGVPALSAYIALLHYGAWSKFIPSVYTLTTVEPDIIISEITNKRLWGKNDRHEEVFISGYHEGFPVSKSYYESVSVGQTIKIVIRKSEWGTHLEFL